MLGRRRCSWRTSLKCELKKLEQGKTNEIQTHIRMDGFKKRLYGVGGLSVHGSEKLLAAIHDVGNLVIVNVSISRQRK